MDYPETVFKTVFDGRHKTWYYIFCQNSGKREKKIRKHGTFCGNIAKFLRKPFVKKLTGDVVKCNFTTSPVNFLTKNLPKHNA